MEIKRIEEKEYFKILKDANIDIPLYCEKEAIDAYGDVILLGVFNNDNPLAVFLAPMSNNGVRRKYRFFPYLMPIILKKENNLLSELLITYQNTNIIILNKKTGKSVTRSACFILKKKR